MVILPYKRPVGIEGRKWISMTEVTIITPNRPFIHDFAFTGIYL